MVCGQTENTAARIAHVEARKKEDKLLCWRECDPLIVGHTQVPLSTLSYYMHHKLPSPSNFYQPAAIER